MSKSVVMMRCLLVGFAVALTALASAMSANAAPKKSQFKVLHNFAGGTKDGCTSNSRITTDGAGNIYGTSLFCGLDNGGVVFKLASDGTETILHAFTGGPDGLEPHGGVTLMRNGDMYGTTTGGGKNRFGTLFKLTRKDKLKVLHDFVNNEGEGATGNLYRDKAGNFYGTSPIGGAGGSGTVFKYGTDGTFTVLHTFNGTDGSNPNEGLVADKADSLYGVAFEGGTHNWGTVFKIDSAGNFSTLHNFTDSPDGAEPFGRLAIDRDGNLYGSTVRGGTSGLGTVFKLAPDGTLTTLYSFTNGTGGANPYGDMLLVGKDLFSTTTTGGDPSCRCGVIYEITSKGNEKVLHTFTGTDGSGYSAGLTLDNDMFYGTVQNGGIDNYGDVFSLTKN